MTISPAPWNVIPADDEYNDLERIVDANGETVCDFGNCEQYYPTEGCPPSDDDMAVIIAAPELLIELQRLVTVFSGDGGSLYTTQTKREAIAKAKEVIVKCGK